MVDDVKAQAVEVLRGNDFGLLPDRGGGVRHGLDRQVARAAVDALAEADLLADGRQWEPLIVDGHERVWCDYNRRDIQEHHGTCPGPHRQLAVAVEAATPAPRYEAEVASTVIYNGDQIPWCKACGALVRDWDTHKGWHDREAG